jgi:signal transduction histidine kinase/FixJ family two-component response regulator
VIPHISERALILAPHGRDAKIAAAVLGEASILTEICDSLSLFQQALERGAGFAILTEEALRSADLHPLAGWIEQQEEWSDFPFILVIQKGGGIERNPAAKRFLDVLGNVTFLERPFHPTTLLSLAESALRGRRRQYEARSRLEELHSVADKYRSLFESIDAGFCIIEMVFDDAGRPIDYIFRETNPAFESQTGLKDAVGQAMRSLAPGHEQHWFDIYGAVALSGEHARFEQEAAALGDIWYDVYAFGIGDPAARQVAVLFNDISPRRKMEHDLRTSEERLRRLNETLEERVVERTEELQKTQGALRQAQKLESIGQLTGGVAHDFNNLLMAILSSLTLLQKRIPDDPNLHRLIDNALQGTHRGAALTQRMLAFARRQDLTEEQVDVAALVRGMTELVERTLGPSWPLDLRLPDRLAPVTADANQMEMALLNLAVNARDAMPDGGAIIIAAELRTVRGKEIEGLAAGAYVGLSVIDTGHGMDAETLDRATEPFFTTKGVGKGTGLGLPMIHGLAKQLGGTFTLQSAVGLGTTATLWLPASETSTSTMSAPESIDMPENVGRLKVLAVDDDGLILMNTAALLEDLGHDVLEATSGAEALDLIRDHGDINLLITDQAMPNMTGTQLVQQVAGLRPDLPIILATGYGEVPPGFETSVIKLGKPFGQNQLEQAVAQALGRNG